MRYAHSVILTLSHIHSGINYIVANILIKEDSPTIIHTKI